MPASLRGRAIFWKGNDMEELIKRLERVIQTGAPDKDGLHPISAEAVLEVVKAQLGTNLAEVGTDCISRQAAIDLLKQMRKDGDMIPWEGKNVFARIRKLPPAQPEIIRCRNCKFASGDSRICMKFGHSPIGELDFCAWAERRTDEE